MNPLCFLLSVTVVWCDPAAQQYAEAAAAVPSEHWRLVKAVSVWRQDGADVTIGAHPGHVSLPADRDAWALWHEVGHLVGERDGRRAGQVWSLVAWHEGRPLWPTPTDYAETDAREDLAESYAAFIAGELADCCPQRAALLVDLVPELAGYEGRGNR